MVTPKKNNHKYRKVSEALVAGITSKLTVGSSLPIYNKLVKTITGGYNE